MKLPRNMAMRINHAIFSRSRRWTRWYFLLFFTILRFYNSLILRGVENLYEFFWYLKICPYQLPLSRLVSFFDIPNPMDIFSNPLILWGGMRTRKPIATFKASRGSLLLRLVVYIFSISLILQGSWTIEILKSLYICSILIATSKAGHNNAWHLLS